MRARSSTRLTDYLPLVITPVASGVAAACALSSASTAHAQQSPVPWGAASAFVGYTWGESGGGFTWGFEGRGGADFREPYACGYQPTFAVGGVGRLSFVALEAQLTVGAQAGIGYGPLSAMGEIGLGHRWGEGGGFSMPLGLELDVWMFQTYFRGDPFLQEVSTGGGVGYPWREFPFSCAVAGRALHDEAGTAPLPTVRAHDERPPVGELAAALTAEWESRAIGEWASVPAFMQLADQLAAVRAPETLVRRAILAAYDEMRHAELAARAAVHHGGGVPVSLGRVGPHTRARATGPDALLRLALESWVDGCLGEGRAAEVARAEARAARCDRAASLQALIARDEAAHAELAWDVLAWSLREGAERVRDALYAARDVPPPIGATTERTDLAEHGVLDAREHALAAERVAVASRARLDRALHASTRA